MICTKCEKNFDGYRCPYCGHFLLDDPAPKRKKNSVYHKQMSDSNQRSWIAYLFLILFVSSWIGLVCWVLMQL